MPTVRFIDEAGNEVAQCRGLDLTRAAFSNRREGMTFGELANATLSQDSDMIVAVEGFKTPEDTADRLEVARLRQRLDKVGMDLQREMTESHGFKQRAMEGDTQLLQAQRIICALVHALGGATSLTDAEIDATDTAVLQTEMMVGGGIMIRVREK